MAALVGLLCAVGTALCYGVGSVLQSVAAAQLPPGDGLDVGLVVRLARSWRYVLGLGLDGLGFVLSLVAVRTLPLFAVQAVVAGFLAVTAVTAALVLHLRLRRAEQLALAAVVLGLVLVGVSAAPEPAVRPGPVVAWLVLASAVVLAAAAVPLGRLRGPSAAWTLGGLAGLAFGVVGVAARLLSPDVGPGGVEASVVALLGSPATYGLLLAAALALTVYAAALQRGSVVQATAPLVVGETVLPALVGLFALGDHARPGWGVAALVGFVVAVGAALAQSRFGDVAPADPALVQAPGGATRQ